MKTLISLITLVALVFIYNLSVSLYLQEQFFFAYSLVFMFVASVTLWIKANDLLAFLSKRAA